MGPNYGAPFGPKVFEKKLSIGKTYFDSEKLFRIGKNFDFFSSVYCYLSSGRCTNPFDLVCVNIFLTDYQLLRNEVENPSVLAVDSRLLALTGTAAELDQNHPISNLFVSIDLFKIANRALWLTGRYE